MAVTVTVKGEPATALEGALMTRFAAGVPQPNMTSPATHVLNAHSRIAASTFRKPRRADLPENLASKPAAALDTLSPPSTPTTGHDMAVIYTLYPSFTRKTEEKPSPNPASLVTLASLAAGPGTSQEQQESDRH
jgi:hypothetical protein